MRFVHGKRAAANPDGVVGWLDQGAAGVVEEGELVEAEGEGKLLLFAGAQGDAGKALEAAGRLLKACSTVAYIALDNFSGGDLAGICNGGGCNYERGGFGGGFLLDRCGYAVGFGNCVVLIAANVGAGHGGAEAEARKILGGDGSG